MQYHCAGSFSRSTVSATSPTIDIDCICRAKATLAFVQRHCHPRHLILLAELLSGIIHAQQQQLIFQDQQPQQHHQLLLFKIANIDCVFRAISTLAPNQHLCNRRDSFFSAALLFDFVHARF